MSSQATGAQPQSSRRFALAGLSALGVVFGDIGTSPLYTLKTVLDYTGPRPDPTAVLGALSLIVWTLVLVVTVKYVNFAMRVDNDGEGGIIALMTLLGVKKHQRPIIIAVGLFGAALIYGDGAITPAISVLSALEGVQQIAPALGTYVLPAAAAILLALFAVQPFGTAAIGRFFGPIMLAWFAVIAALGVYGILQHPQVFIAIDPRYGLDYLSRSGFQGFLVLGGVFLCVTGPRRSTPTWAISARSRFGWRGASSCFRPSSSTTPGRRRSCSPARRPKAISSTGFAPTRC